ncbi:MAG TPA: hypothetical protein VEB18_03260 [Candidatus Paceibacterota bacterium]|nr:hypothetical protein [Candidatus Paceibacterota bacterium]
MKNPLIWIVLVIILVGLGWWIYTVSNAPAGQALENDPGSVAGEFIDDSKDGGAGQGPAAGNVTITYTDAGFSPETITVRKGATITFVDESPTNEMWVGADEHPSHTGYDGTSKDEHCPNTDNTSFDQCGVGSTYSFTFTKVGVFTYHNHREDDHHGHVVVVE